MKRARVGMIATAVLAVATMAFAQKPDFSGTWTPDAERGTGAPAGHPAGGGGTAGGGMAWRRRRPRHGGGPMTVKQTGDTLTIEPRATTGHPDAPTSSTAPRATHDGPDGGEAVHAKWDGGKLVITTKTEQGEQVQTWSLAGGNAHHRAYRRTRSVEDDLQEDHLVRSWVSDLGGRERSLPAFFLCGCPTLRPKQLPAATPPTVRPVTGSSQIRHLPQRAVPERRSGLGSADAGPSDPPRPRHRRRRESDPGRGSAERRDMAVSVRSRARSASSAIEQLAWGESVSPTTAALRYNGCASRPAPSGLGVDGTGDADVVEETGETFDGEGSAA